jgi:hypothetical protein
LYAVGQPTAESPVFVTANYTLSFDALRAALAGIDGYLLVLDTQGVNVWCAAGKGTFGSEELARRIEATRLAEVVSHRRLILPQLGAPGVSAHEVRRRTGFGVEYGPVRAADLLEYLSRGEATPEMRRVRFGMLDRIVLIPVELRHVFWPTMIGAVALGLAVGWVFSLGMVTAVLAGVGLFAILLPWIPTREFTSKGLILGMVVAAPFVAELYREMGQPAWRAAGWAAAFGLLAIAVTAFLALNFTGSTPFTSRTGVRREIARYTRALAVTAGTGIMLLIVMILMRALGRG